MTALPRGYCSVCGDDVALRKGGLVREHRVLRPHREMNATTGRYRHPISADVCTGSGKPSA